jgi:phage shock protein A
MMNTTHKTSQELREDHKRAVQRVKELQAEEASLPARTQEAAQNAAQRRLNGSVGDSDAGSEVSALTQRRGEIPHDIHAARVHAARLELDRVNARKREEQSAYDDLEEGEELAFDGKEEATRYWKGIKAERDAHASSNYMLDYDLRRAMDALARVEGNVIP